MDNMLTVDHIIPRHHGVDRNMTGSMFGRGDSSSLKYYCMSCGTQHKQAACPKCGSKMKRVGS